MWRTHPKTIFRSLPNGFPLVGSYFFSVAIKKLFGGGILLFFGSYEKIVCGGHSFLVKSVHKSLIYIGPKGWDWPDKNWSGQKGPPPPKKCFFQAQNRKKNAKKTEISLCLLKSHVFFGMGGGLLSGRFNFYPITHNPSGQWRLDFCKHYRIYLSYIQH